MKTETSVEFWSHIDMPYVETRRACQSRICYKSHSHPTFSIGAVDVGESRFKSHFSTEQKIASGSLVFIPPHIEHSCNPMPDQAWSYQMMHLDADWLQNLIQEIIQQQKSELPNISSAYLPTFGVQIIQQPLVYQSFTQLNQCLFDPDIDVIEKQQFLIEVLTQILFPHFEWDDLKLSQYFHQRLNQLIYALEQHNQMLSLDDLSQHFGVSPFAIIRLFKNNFGLTPHAFQLNYKINQARSLLKKGESILWTTHHLGFTDQSHFHRVFKSHTGITPKQYQTPFLG